jgi:hypothetical protein
MANAAGRRWPFPHQHSSTFSYSLWPVHHASSATRDHSATTDQAKALEEKRSKQLEDLDRVDRWEAFVGRGSKYEK